MKLLISGDRRWSDTGLIKEILEIFDRDTVIICYIDFVIVVPVAQEMGFLTEKVEDVVDTDNLIIFHKYIRGSVRCKKLTKSASEAGIPYQIVGSSFN